MARDDKLRTLIDRLLDKTMAGELRWKEGVRWNSFQTDLPDHSYVVYGDAAGSIGLGQGLDAMQPKSFLLRVVDQRGEPVLSVPTGAGIEQLGTVEQQESLERLFHAARRSTSPSEQAIDDLLAELS